MSPNAHPSALESTSAHTSLLGTPHSHGAERGWGWTQAAIKYWGTSTNLNFPADDYASELAEISRLTTEELVAQVRRHLACG
jgi:hypothetical protein